MKRVFIQESSQGIIQVKILDYEDQTFTTYYQDKTLGFPFGEQFTQKVKNMGYIDIKDCYKKLKSRGLLKQEISIEDQLKSEKIGLINLGIDRIKRHKEINTKHFTDVIEKLRKYGLGFVDAENMIIAGYQNSIH